MAVVIACLGSACIAVLAIWMLTIAVAHAVQPHHHVKRHHHHACYYGAACGHYYGAGS